MNFVVSVITTLPMEKDTTPTKMIFRKWKDTGAIIALFPDQNFASGDANKGFIMSYMHVGQHGEASEQLLTDRKSLVTAKPQEYADLLAELKSLGYLPQVNRKIFY